MACLAAHVVQLLLSTLSNVKGGAFGNGEALVFAFPFVFVLDIVAQAHPLALLCVVREGQTDGQGRVQLGDEFAFAVQQSDVQNSVGQPFLVE